MGRAPFRQALVLHLDNLRGQVAIRRVPPKGVDIQSLHVDATLVQIVYAVGAKTSAAPACVTFERGTFHYVGHFGDGGVRMYVHHLYAFPAHAHFPPGNGSVGLRRLRYTCYKLSRQKRSSRPARYVLDDLS